MGHRGHSEANVSKSAFFIGIDSRRLSNTCVKHEPPEAYLSTLAVFDVQKHIMFLHVDVATRATSQHFRVSARAQSPGLL